MNGGEVANIRERFRPQTWRFKVIFHESSGVQIVEHATE